MAKQEHLHILNQGISIWNQWREEHMYPYMIIPDLSESDLQGMDLSKCDLSYANLSGANLLRVNLSHANLSGANLSHIPLISTRFEGTNLSGANLPQTIGEADFSGANLSNAVLTRAILLNSTLFKANLTNANLIDADLTNANLIGADLTNTDLTNANLARTNFSGARFDHMTLVSAQIGQTIFAYLDLRTAHGLSTLKHVGPSIVDLNTVFLPSDMQTRASFLRGVGFPDPLIHAYGALYQQIALSSVSLFLHFHPIDQNLAEKLSADLRVHGLSCWLTPHIPQGGFPEYPPRSLLYYLFHSDRSLLLLSRNAVESSWIEEEVQPTLAREQHEHRLIYYALRLDDAILTASYPWARALRQHHPLIDWTNTDEYQQALMQLITLIRKEHE